MYRAYVTRVTNIRPAENADRLNACEVFGNTTIIDKSITEDDTIVYFPSDGQISIEFGEKNNLFRRKDDAGNNVGGFIDPVKRNITAIRLRGNRSDGLVLPLSCLNYCYAHGDASIELRVGDVIDGCVNGHEICQKYIPRTSKSARVSGGGNKTRKHKTPTAPLFAEHADTEQLAYNLSAFKSGDEIEITLKCHGTSQRTGYLPVLQGYKDTWPCRVGNAFRHILNKLDGGHREDTHDGEPIYDWGYVSGTRRVVLDSYEGGFYGDNQFREQHSKVFEGKLNKGETVYYEVVGFTTSGQPIMGDASNKKLNDKEFIKQYGETTRFSYGCAPDGKKTVWGKDEDGNYSIGIEVPQSDIYVYRMTMTNEDGFVIEYTPDFMRYRCEQMGVKCVPVFYKGTIPEFTDHIYLDKNGNEVMEDPERVYSIPTDPGAWVVEKAEQFYDGPDPIGKTHVREGVVVRIINRPKFTAYKHKNFSFKCIEGIIKDTAAAPDMEEAQDVSEDT